MYLDFLTFTSFLFTSHKLLNKRRYSATKLLNIILPLQESNYVISSAKAHFLFRKDNSKISLVNNVMDSTKPCGTPDLTIWDTLF